MGSATNNPPRGRIIIVDDIPDNLELLKMALEMNGFEVCAALSARDLITHLLNGHWDAILLDVNLPDELGTETAKRIRSNHPEIPIAFLTAYSSSEALKSVAGKLGIPIWDRVDMTDVKKLVESIGQLAHAA